MTTPENLLVTAGLIKDAARDYAHYVASAQVVKVELWPGDDNRFTVEIVPTDVQPFSTYFKRWMERRASEEGK